MDPYQSNKKRCTFHQLYPFICRYAASIVLRLPAAKCCNKCHRSVFGHLFDIKAAGRISLSPFRSLPFFVKFQHRPWRLLHPTPLSYRLWLSPDICCFGARVRQRLVVGLFAATALAFSSSAAARSLPDNSASSAKTPAIRGNATRERIK